MNGEIIMNDFNADQYRDDLRKKLGVKDMPMQKSDNVVNKMW
jgi:hypothetical protein